MDKIIVQTDDFDLTTEVNLAKANNPSVGAIVSFVGTVRDVRSKSLNSLTLEHYPGMTEKSLELIATKAREKWELQNITIIHRIGTLNVNDQIVLVITTSRHRQEAFDSCNFIIDYLKTDAPFWKKELSENNEGWVETRVSDEKQKKRWKS
jgi:molybdopterin synthase catalytic subunit